MIPNGVAACANTVSDRALIREVHLRHLHGDSDFFAELVDLFFESLADLMPEISSAISNGDTKTLETAAHSLKGMVSEFRDTGAVEAAEGLESAAHDGNLLEAEPALDRLVRQIDELESALAELRMEFVHTPRRL